MMKIILPFLFAAPFALADNGESFNDKKGFWILSEVPHQNARAHQPGETPTLKGKICLAKLKSGDRIKCDNIEEEHLDIKAYFPDEVTEVTDAVSFKKRNGSIEYQYKTPPLSLNVPNALTIVIGKIDHRAKVLLKTKAKLEKRIAHFRERLAKYGTVPKHEKRRQILLTYIETYEKYLAYINKWLRENPSIIAQMSQPIQVGNNISSPLIHSSIFDKVKISLNIPNGAPIKGESVTVKSEITFIADRRAHFSDDDLFGVSYYLDGRLVAAQPQLEAESGQPVQFEFQLNILQSDKANLLEVEVVRLEVRDHRGRGRWDWFRNWLDDWRHRGGHGHGSSPDIVASLQQSIIVSPDAVSPTWANVSPGTDVLYAQNFPGISAEATDTFGRLNASAFKLKLSGQDLTSRLNLAIEDFGRKIVATADVNPVAEGIRTMELSGADYAGNAVLPNPLVRTIHIDRTPPEVTILTADQQITNFNQATLKFKVSDATPVTASIYVNSQLIEAIAHDGQGGEVSRIIMLAEGMNQIEVRSVDAAGNHGQTKLITITLDTVPPILSNFSPANNAVINTLNLSISGKVNEPLSSLKANNEDVAVKPDLTFQWAHALLTQGTFQATFTARDLAGNTSEVTVNYQIILEPLIMGLITVEPRDDGRIVVRGVEGASVPGIEVTARGGLFNSATVSSNADGSFEIVLDRASSVTVSATANGISRSIALNVNVNTTLSGIVKNSLNGNPLMGVRVSVDGGQGQFVLTDGNGVFSIQNIPTGDRIVHFDGTQIPEELRGPNHKFFATKVSINVGVNQKNVLQDTVYLTPLITDGTETQIAANQTATVTSPHASGVILSIPAGKATFPDGLKSGTISMVRIDSNRTSVPPLEFVKPDKVVALEPSGLKFSEPVQLTLPNENEIMPGVQVVIFSKNSDKGIWEIDGVGRVSADGSSITTEPGQGITHFSEIYAAPLGPKVTPIGAQDRPGADTFNGALTTQIEMPSVKSLGQTITPTLIYKSSWANPSVAVTSLVDIPRNEVELTPVNQGVRNILVKANVQVTGRSWVEPEYIETQFITDNITSEKLKLTGMPNKSVISYGLDLASVSSGVHPYSNRIDIRLKQMTVGTIRTSSVDAFGGTKTNHKPFRETRIIEQVFPQDSAGQIFTLNKVNSEVGRGWKIGGVSRLHGLDGPRITLEEGDGSMVSYGLANTIETLYDAGASELKAVDLSLWPFLTFVDQTNRLKKLDLSDPAHPPALDRSVERTNPSSFFTNITVEFQLNSPPPATIFGIINDPVRCRRVKFGLSYPRDVRGILDGGSAGMYGVDITGALFKATETGSQTLTAVGTQLQRSVQFWRGSGCHDNAAACPGHSFCQASDISKRGTCGIVEGPYVGVPASQKAQIRLGWPASPLNSVQGTVCEDTRSLQPEYPVIGIQNGPASVARFNDPINISKGFGENLLVVDHGNNLIRSVSLSDFSVSTLAGNGQNLDIGDNGPATQASLFHPLAAAYDSLGNLYVATERGLIRKVDTRGIVTRYAGKLPGEGGVLRDQAHAEDMIFSRPAGLALDNANGYLYVADTGNNRVVQIDLSTKNAIVVAGNGTCDAVGTDGIAALNSSLCNPEDVGIDSSGNLIVADTGHKRIRRVMFNQNAGGTIRYLSSNNDLSSLTKNSDGTFKRSLRNGTEVVFDNAGKHISSIDKAGRGVSSEYDSEGRLRAQVNSVGQRIEFTYIGGLLESVKDSANRVTRFQYSGQNLDKVTFPDGTTKKYQYNPKGLIVSETDQREITLEYSYNEYHRLLSVKRSDGTTVAINDSTSATLTNSFTGGSSGSLKSYGTGPDEVYDGIKDAKSIETKFVKDVNGFVTTIIDATGAKTEVSRAPDDGRILKLVRPDTTTVEYEYHPVTRDILKIKDTSTGKISEMAYDTFGNRILDKSGTLQSEKVFDPATNLIVSSKNPSGNVTTYTHNSLGLVTRISTPLDAGRTYLREFEYNNAGLLTKETATGGLERRYGLDLAGNVLLATEVRGVNDELVTSNEYDNFNRLLKVTSPKNEITSYKYLGTGQLSEVKNHTGQVMTFSFDDLGRMIEKKDFANRVYKFSYDENNNVTRIEEPGPRIKTFEYDNLNRMSAQVLPDDRFEFSYDIRGNLISSKNKNSLLEFELDVLGRLKSSTVTGLGDLSNYPKTTITNEFNVNDQRTKMTDSFGGVVAYSHQADGRLQQITNHKGENFQYQYNLAGAVTKITRPGGESLFTYQDDMTVQSITHKRGTEIEKYFNYVYNRLKMPTSITSSDGAESVTYDTNSYLTGFSQPAARLNADSSSFASETFSYDSIGNRTSDQRGALTYDPTGQLITSDYKYTYFHDSHGNINFKVDKTTGAAVKYDYSSQNQLIKVSYLPDKFSTSPTKVVTYAFDASGRRLYKDVKDNEALADKRRTFSRYFVYDNEEIIFETDQNKAILARYTHSTLRTDDILAVDITSVGVGATLASTAGTYTFLKDALGTVRAIANVQGEIVQNYTYSAYGSILAIKDRSGVDRTTNPEIFTTHTFTGREMDWETGLYYYRARHYDSNIGRFLQRDPDPGDVDDPISIVNKRIYASNRPTYFIDPTGEIVWAIPLIVGAIGAALNAGAALEATGGVFNWQVLGSALTGFVTGAATPFVVANPLFIGAIAQGLAIGLTAFLSGFANNAINQSIFNGGPIRWDNAVASGGFALAGVAAGRALLGTFDIYGLNPNNPAIKGVASGFGSLVGSQKENGIPRQGEINYQY